MVWIYAETKSRRNEAAPWAHRQRDPFIVSLEPVAHISLSGVGAPYSGRSRAEQAFCTPIWQSRFVMSVSVDVRHHQNAAARVAHKHVEAIVAFILSRGGRCGLRGGLMGVDVLLLELEGQFFNGHCWVHKQQPGNNGLSAGHLLANLSCGCAVLVSHFLKEHCCKVACGCVFHFGWGLWLGVAPLPMFKV